jgi:hypothetical protein
LRASANIDANVVVAEVSRAAAVGADEVALDEVTAGGRTLDNYTAQVVAGNDVAFIIGGTADGIAG